MDRRRLFFGVDNAVASNPWDITTASYLQTFALSGTNASGLFFKPDGTKMYVLNNADEKVYEYHLSTAWDSSTAVYFNSKSILVNNPNNFGLFFSANGTKMYVTTYGNTTSVYQFNLSTAWTVSTATYSTVFNAGTKETYIFGISFKPDGTKMYLSGTASDNINEYNLSTAWNISTSTYLQLFSVLSQSTNSREMFFKPDGLAVFLNDMISGFVYRYNLSTAWNISTASFSSSKDISGTISSPAGLFFKPDGTKMYVTGNVNNNVYEFNL